MLSPCVKPMRRLPCVTTLLRAVGMGKLVVLSLLGCCCWPSGAAAGAEAALSGMSKSPLTSWRSGAMLRRKE